MPNMPEKLPWKPKRVEGPRPTRQQRGYGAEWQRIRKVVLAQEPVCSCGQWATQVHHKDGNTANVSRENLKPLCASCHSKITRKEQLGLR